MPDEKTWNDLWQERVGAFASKVGAIYDVVTENLAMVVGPPSEAALEALADPDAATFEDIKSALAVLNIPPAILRRNVGLLRGPKPEPVIVATAAEVAATTTSATLSPGMGTDILPPIPDDESFTAALKVGGELKVGQTEVLSAVKAALAARVGLYDLPDTLKDRMERFAEETEEPVGKAFFDLRNLVARRQYADVLSVLGIEGSFMSEARKNRFLGRLDEGLWTEVQGFHNQLLSWQQSWVASAGNPAIMMTFMAAGLGGAGAVPPGMMQPPETDTLRDSAEAVVNRINRVFSGLGIPVARALAYDAQRIKDVLTDDRLPAAVGAVNREQMLKMLGVEVAADYVRLERNITRYILAIMELGKVTAGQTEIAYLGAMLQLGNAIPWAKLMGRTATERPTRRESENGTDERIPTRTAGRR